MKNKQQKDNKKSTAKSVRLHEVVIWLSFSIGFVIIIIGRIKSFHHTEMEALVYGWKYWLGGMFFLTLPYWIHKLKKSR